MSKANQRNYNVLMQVQNQNESERLIGIFRTGGMAVRAHRITSETDFNESIADSHWDLLVSDNRHPEVSLKFSLDTLKKQQCDIPVLLLTDEINRDIRDQAFNLGIQDVIEKTDEIHFIHAAIREMQNARHRISQQSTSLELQELKKRADMLMAESDDAIAYVSDGILTQVNDKFAELFAYSADDMDFMSIIDLVSQADHDKFKSAFRYFSKEGGKQTELSIQAIKKDKQTLDVAMLLSKASIDGEPCTQITISTGAKASAGNDLNAGIYDAATGLYNRYYLSEQITSTALQIGKGIPSASLLLFQLDDSDKLLEELGFSSIDRLIKDLSKLLEQAFGEQSLLARVGDNSLAVIVQKTAEKALPLCKTVIKSIEDHICDLESRTVQYTCLCCVTQISSKEAQISLDNAFAGLCDIRAVHNKNYADIFAAKAAARFNADAISSIDEALELKSFKLLYQPLMSLHGDTVENYETTLWFNDGNQDSYPEALINKAGNTKLDRWILIEATKALALHRAKGHNTRLIINLTANALIDDSLAPWLGVAIKAANLSNDALIFQFRETDIKNNLKHAIKAVSALRNAKFRVSIAQFGAEPDPFKLLKHLALDVVKFNAELNSNSASLKALIAQAKENNIQTITPDIDNASMLASMWQLGTHYIQGSYLQLPSPDMNFEFADIA